ncbi:unnamed protein product [Leptosia nina]|uniref:Uncharacterized protein n=1 Tax=Leptosia nina TaxID=320188 RepID=A0AAV1K493_9NEOP
MHSLLILKYILASVCFVYASPVAFEVKKCESSDSKCLKSVTQELIPRFAEGLSILSVDPLDPMFVDKVDASTPNLKLMLTDLKITGLKGCIAKKIERDAKKSFLSVTLQCTVDVEGHYDMNGRLLVLPLEGNDKFQAKLDRAIFKVEGNYEEIERDGEKYWNIIKWDHGFKLHDKSTVHFDNLFNGNKDLAQAAQQVISESGNEIINEVGPPVVKAILTKIVDGVQEFFHAIPSKDLALD